MDGFREMADAMSGDAGRAMRADERTFLDRTKTVYSIVEEAS